MNFIKDPDDTENYVFDFAGLENGTGDSNWLDRDSSPVEYITTRVVTEGAGLSANNGTLTNNNTSVTVQVLGGTAGSTYTLACKITTSTGRIHERTATITVTQR